MDAHQQQQELTIKTLAGATFVLPIIDFEVVTVGEIKVMLADRQGGFPVLAQRLIYCGAELADDARTLGHYGVMHETCLHLVERAAAGGGGAGASSSEHPVDAAPRAQREAELARLANAYGTLYADIERCVDARAEQTVDEVRAESRAIAAAAASGGACPEADRLENNAATLRASHSATVNSPSLMAGSPEADQLDKQAAGARQKAGAARAQGRAAVQTGDIEDAQARRAEADAAEATANVLEDQALQVRASALQQMRSAMARVAAAADELGEEARRARVAAAAIADGLADRRAALHLPVTLEGSCGAEVIRLLEERDASLAEGNVERARHLYANAKAYTALKAKLAGLAASQWLAQEAELQAFRDHRNALATQRDEVLHADVAALREEIRLLNSKGTAMRTDIHRLYADAEARADAEAKAQAEAEAKVAALREKIRRLTSEGTAMRTEIHRLCAEAEARTEAEAKARAEAEAKARAEAEAKARAEAEAKARAEAEAKARAETEAKARAEAEAKAREEAKARAEAEAKARAAEQAAAAAATLSTWTRGLAVNFTVVELRVAQRLRGAGRIPTEIGLLTHLAYLDASDNQLPGNIPTELGLCTAMTYLGLNSNQLTGNIPTELGLCTAMQNVQLQYNELTGNIPTELGLCTGMMNLRLDYNQLTGNIPTELGLCTGMTGLWLGDNELTGKAAFKTFMQENVPGCRVYL